MAWRCLNCSYMNSDLYIYCRKCGQKPWSCPKCGTRNNKAKAKKCYNCGFKRPSFAKRKRGEMRKAAKEEYPEEFEHMEELYKGGKKWRARATKAGMASRVTTGHRYVQAVRDQIIQIAILLVAGSVSIILGFPFLGVGLILLTIYIILPDEYDIMSEVRGEE